MSESKEMPSVYPKDASQKRPVKSTKSTATETFYGSIISTALESLKAAK
jgi:hypothetical protein